MPAGHVMIPRSQMPGAEERGMPLTVQVAQLTLTSSVKWFDNDGRPHTEIVFLRDPHTSEGMVYRDRGGEEWASRLQPFKEEMAAPMRAAAMSSLGVALLSAIEKNPQLQDRLVTLLSQRGVLVDKSAAVSTHQDDIDALTSEVHADVSAS